MNSDDKSLQEQSEQLLPLDFIDSDNDKLEKTTQQEKVTQPEKKIEAENITKEKKEAKDQPLDNSTNNTSEKDTEDKLNTIKLDKQNTIKLDKPKTIKLDKPKITSQKTDETPITAEKSSEDKSSEKNKEEATPTPSPAKPRVINPAGVKKTTPLIKEKKLDKKSDTSNKKNNQEKPLASIKINSDSSLGQILREARIRKKLSVEQIAQSTKIKKKFITALEEEKYDLLPAKVYISAYIRSLTAIYDIDPKTVLDKIPQESKHNHIPDDLINHIQEGKQVNSKEEEKIKKIITIAGIAIASIIILIIIIAVWPSKKHPSATIAETSAPNTEQENQQGVENHGNTSSNHSNFNTVTSDDLKIFIYPKPFTMTHAEIPQN